MIDTSITTQPHHINLNALLEIPGKQGMFLKTLDGYYQACNDVTANMLNLGSRKDINGMTDRDLPIRPAQAAMLRCGDIDVLEAMKPLQFEYQVTLPDNFIAFSTVKMPMLNASGDIIGIFGIDSIHSQTKLDYSVIKNLSVREADCLHLLVRGKTAKDIGEVLRLSTRTVESYIENIKSKLGCRKRADIIEKVLINNA